MHCVNSVLPVTVSSRAGHEPDLATPHIHSRVSAEKLVYIFHNMRAIRKIENVASNTKYAADVEAMLLEQSIGRGSEAESSHPSDSSDSD